MNALISFCIQHRLLVIFVVLLIGAVGVRAAKNLPIDAVPDVTNVQVQVLTNSPALGPVDVEQYITAPVEAAMGGLPNVEEVRSLSRFGLSAVTIVFEEGTDLYFARQLVTERLTAAREAIPSRYGTPALGPISTGLGEIYQFEVRGEPMCPSTEQNTERCYTTMELREVLDWYVALQLRPLPGVVEVNPFGGELKTYEVRVDASRLDALGVSARQLFDALDANNANAGGGYIVRGGEQRLIRAEGLITSLDDVRDVRVTTHRDGTPVFVRDLARVTFAPMLRQGAVTRDGRGEVVTASVMMLMGANAGEVTRAVKDRLDALAPGLPPGVTIEPYYDRSELVDRTIRTVAVNLIEGGALVVIVLLLMLGNLRAGLLVAAIIPLSLLVTFISLRYFGISGNLMSLGALDFGLIIDGAIVVVENISRRLSDSRNQGISPRELTRSATTQVIKPVLFGTAIIMVVYIPILTLQGIEGKMFTPMAIAVLSALAAALLLAFTFIPAAASWLYRGATPDREPWLARTLQAAYDPLLAAVMRHRVIVIGAAILALGVGAWVASRMGAEFVPELDEGAIAMQAVRPPSVSLEESIDATTRIEAELIEAFPTELETVVSRTGRAEIATDPMGVEVSDIYLMLRPREEWVHASTKDELLLKVQDRLEAAVPGQNYSFSQPIELRTNELISGARSDVAINLYGEDLNELERSSARIMNIVRDVPGAADVNADRVAGLPTSRVIIDRSAAARYGVDASDVLDVVEMFGGKHVGTILEGQRRFALQVRFEHSARDAPASLNTMRITTADGRRVPLGQIARVITEDGPAVVSRENAQRRVTIQVNVRDRDLASFVTEARDRVREDANLPTGYFVTWGGQFENLEAASERLAVAVPMALTLIFLLLYTMFGSARTATLVYVNVPISAIGGVLALWARDMPFSISAAIGFIALSGIAVLNGVVLVSYIRELQAAGCSRIDAATRGASLRLRAILMTAMTDGLGFLPMALSSSAGAEVQQPLATVILGGLATSTLLTLFVLPAVYSLFGPESSGEVT